MNCIQLIINMIICNWLQLYYLEIYLHCSRIMQKWINWKFYNKSHQNTRLIWDSSSTGIFAKKCNMSPRGVSWSLGQGDHETFFRLMVSLTMRRRNVSWSPWQCEPQLSPRQDISSSHGLLDHETPPPSTKHLFILLTKRRRNVLWSPWQHFIVSLTRRQRNVSWLPWP